MELLTPKSVQVQRIKICTSCERLFKLTMMCKECGCFLPLKTRLADQACPLQKWEEHKS